MPGIDGREVARRIRSEEEPGRDVLLVAISGWARASDVEDSLACGFDYYLVKPVDVEAIAQLCSG
jgi:two-component system CheB/CheR fusion protein